MQKVKTFFHVFVNSLLPQANYYHKLLKTPFSFSIKYFFILVFFVNFIFTILFLVRLQNSGYLSLKDTVPASLEKYPSNLSITIENGRLHTNSDKPFFFWLDIGKTKRLVAVVDETATSDKIIAYNSLLLLTSEKLVVKKNAERIIEDIPYGNTNLKINKTYVENLRQDLIRMFSLGAVLVPIVLLALAPLLFILLYLIYFFIITLLVFIPFKFFSKKIRLSKSFQLSLHAVTLPVVIDYGLCLFKPEIAFYPVIYWVFLGLTVLFIFAGIYEAFLDPVTRTHH